LRERTKDRVCYGRGRDISGAPVSRQRRCVGWYGAAVAYAAVRLGKPAKIFIPSVSNFDITRWPWANIQTLPPPSDLSSSFSTGRDAAGICRVWSWHHGTIFARIQCAWMHLHRIAYFSGILD
jgi:hypothetical protein